MPEVQATATARADDDQIWAQSPRTLDEKQLSKVLTEPVVVDVPPDGGYGWVCVACCFTVNAMTWGVNSVRGFWVGVGDDIGDCRMPADGSL